MRKILITGFEPFGGSTVNPSWLAVQALPDKLGQTELTKLEIPTVFGKAAAIVLEKARKIGADTIICVGVAAGRDAVTPERIAVNIRDARIPDNAGGQPQGDFVVANGPAAYFSTLPVEKITQAIHNAGVRASVSNSAGTYVCNDVFYSLLHAFYDTDVRVGFIHVPQLSESDPQFTLEHIVTALTAAINACK